MARTPPPLILSFKKKKTKKNLQLMPRFDYLQFKLPTFTGRVDGRVLKITL